MEIRPTPSDDDSAAIYAALDCYLAQDVKAAGSRWVQRARLEGVGIGEDMNRSPSSDSLYRRWASSTNASGLRSVTQVIPRERTS